MKLQTTCIICPRGCQLKVDDDLTVHGHSCPRGKAYAIQEATAPRRALSSTAVIDSRCVNVIPVQSAAPLPKGSIEKALGEIRLLHLKAPIHEGDVLIPDLAGTGIPLLASCDILI